MTDRICPIEFCTGCMACYNACVHQAIVITEDSCGFSYPLIDAGKCINCGVCRTICPVIHPLKRQEPLTVYAAYSRDEQDRMTSTSGGASSVFSQVMLQKKGVVYGCVQESYKSIKHQPITNERELWKMKGSKYVQSEIGDVFRAVRSDLITGKLVLFTGTPCQIAGLRVFLRKDYSNLLTVDLVCHGVPSRKLLEDDIQDMLYRESLPLKESYRIFFRKKGIRESDLKFGCFIFDCDSENSVNEMASVEYPFDYYIAGFMTGLFYRQSCYTCAYANPLRCADITIGDFWGLGKSRLDTARGISAVLINTEKGKDFFEACKDKFEYEERVVKEAVQGNGQLQKPSVKAKNYDLFRQLYPKMGFKRAAKRCLRPFYRNYYWCKLKNNLRRNPVIYHVYRVLKNIS